MMQNPKKKKTDFAEGFASICEPVCIEEVLLNSRKGVNTNAEKSRPTYQGKTEEKAVTQLSFWRPGEEA